MPDCSGGEHLIAILWKLGPFRGELPLSDQDLWYWQERQGVILLPWQAEILIDMSKAYLSEMHLSRPMRAQPPWEYAVPMWRYVCDELVSRARKYNQEVNKVVEQMKEQAPNGNRKRR